jgi:hypothetical protein
MATLASHVALLPPILREKYKDAFWISACNEILEKLSSEKLMRELTYRRGVIVKDSIWVTPPSDCRDVLKIANPFDWSNDIAFELVDGKVMLLDRKWDEETDPDTATTFETFTLTSIKINIDGLAVDDYKDYLMVITSGTMAGETIILSGNDASSGGKTVVHFQHGAPSLLDALKITGADLIQPGYYLALVYKSSYSDLAATTEEVPIDDKFEKRVMRAGLMKYGYERLYDSQGTVVAQWRAAFDKAIQEMRSEILPTPAKIMPSSWAGLGGGSVTTIHGKEAPSA